MRNNSLMTEPERRYSGVAIGLHWVMAGLILFMIWLGHNMSGNELRFQLHKSIGIALLILTIARIVWRLFNKPPTLPQDLKPFERALSKSVQFGFYTLMLVIPLGGWLMVSVSPFAVPTVLFDVVSWPNLPFGRSETAYKLLAFLHGKGATIGFMSLLVLHISGALKHHFGQESGVIQRILPSSKTYGPKTIKGIIPTLGTSIGFFLVVISVPIFAQNRAAAESIESMSNSIDPNWRTINEKSSINFSFSHDGNDYVGSFERWDAKIEFYKERLEESYVFVEVDLSSAFTGKKLYDDSLKASEWFDVKTKPGATVSLVNFRALPAPNHFIADGILDLKGLQVNFPFAFELEFDDNLAKMLGDSRFSRQILNIGQDSDPDAEWVSEKVVVNVQLEAVRSIE